jgi:hypothetical protein
MHNTGKTLTLHGVDVPCKKWIVNRVISDCGPGYTQGYAGKQKKQEGSM